MKKLLISLTLILLLFIIFERINCSQIMKIKSKINKKINVSGKKNIKVNVGKKHGCKSKQKKFCKKICRKSKGLKICIRKAKISYIHKKHRSIHFLILRPLCICNKYSYKFRVISKK